MKKITLLLILVSTLGFGQLKISQLPSAGTLTGAELFPAAQGTVTVKIPLSTLPYIPTSSVTAFEPKLNGTGFVVSNGTVTSYDNTSYIPTSSVSAFQPTIAGGYLPVINPTFTGTLTTGTLPYTDTGILAAFQSSTNGYNQVIVSNTSNAANASANFIAGNNLGTATSNFVEMGMNSSTFTGTTIFDQPGSGYLAATTGTLNIGTRTAHPVQFAANNASTSAITINTLNAVTVAGGQTITAGSVPNAGIVIRDLVGTSTSGGVYFGKTPDATNYSFAGDNAGNAMINWPTGSAAIFQTNGATTMGSVSDTRWSLQPGAATSGANNAFRVLCPNSTGLTASTNVPDIAFTLASNKQWAAGNFTVPLTFFDISQPQARYVGASTSPTIATMIIRGAPNAGSNASHGISTGLFVPQSTVNAVGSVTTSYGVYSEAQVGATSNYAAGFSGGLGVFLNDINVVLGTTTGTKFGTATTQKLGFFNATPVVQQAAATDPIVALSNLGFRAAGTAWPLTTTGNVSFGNVASSGSITSTSKTLGVGYAVGSGSTVTQATSRTTGVTINAVTGSITLVSAAGSILWQTFTVTNSAVTAKDVIIVNQQTGTDLNMIMVTNVAAGSFKISFATTGGTTVETPVFNFAVIKGQTN